MEGFTEEETLRALEIVYPERVAARRKWYAVDGTAWLPPVLWTMVLSRCWKRSLTIMLVCKAWLALTRTPAYWRQAYVEKMCIFPEGFPDFAKDYFLTGFHTFDAEIFPTWKSMLAWLFCKNSGKLKAFHLEKDGYFTAVIPLYDRDIAYIVYTGYGISVNVSLYKDKSLFRKRLLPASPVYCQIIRKANKESAIVDYLDWIDTRSNLRWKGTGRPTVPGHITAIPDGKGTWYRYSTGEVLLQGDDVAIRGIMDDGGVTYHRGKRVKPE